MTPAELKTIRESLSLTAQWLADHAGVKLRSVQYWESGRSPVPADVAEFLLRIDATLEGAAKLALDVVDDKIKAGQAPRQVALVRYRTDEDLWRFRPDMRPLPAATHAVLLSRVRRGLWSRGVPSVIEYMAAEKYLPWLGDRIDSEAERAAWAVSINA